MPQTSPISERERLERQAVAVHAVRRPGVVAGVGAQDPAADPDEHQPPDRVRRAPAREQEAHGGEAAVDRVGRAVASERELVAEREDRQQRDQQHEHDRSDDARAPRRRPPREAARHASPPGSGHTGNLDPRRSGNVTCAPAAPVPTPFHAPSRRPAPSAGPRRAVAFRPCASRPGTSTRSSSACRACCPGWTSAGPDVVCLQETKLADDAFDELLGEELAGRGYAVARHGEVQWNGVAILSRVGLDDVRRGIPGAPGFPHAEARAVAATLRRDSRPLGLRAQRPRPGLRALPLQARVARGARALVGGGPRPAIVCGDMNIAPADIDVFDPHAYVGQTHVTPPERAALAELQALGLHDVVRDRWPAERVFTYWDYRAGMFHKDLGMRIDLVLASAPVADRVEAAWVDRQARKGTGPSDHAPVIVDLDEAPDGDIGPVVPPPVGAGSRAAR